MNFKNNLEKLGTIGVLIFSFFSPCCFPLYVVIASTLGLSCIKFNSEWGFYVFLIMIVISLIGFIKSFHIHKSKLPLLIAIPSIILILIDYFTEITILNYSGMIGLISATIINNLKKKSEITSLIQSDNNCCK
jgi:hypothetical protein